MVSSSDTRALNDCTEPDRSTWRMHGPRDGYNDDDVVTSPLLNLGTNLSESGHGARRALDAYACHAIELLSYEQCSQSQR